MSQKEKFDYFIERIEELNRKMNIPDKISKIKDCDLDKLISHAIKEANPLYPVPEIWDKKDFLEIYLMLKD